MVSATKSLPSKHSRIMLVRHGRLEIHAEPSRLSATSRPELASTTHPHSSHRRRTRPVPRTSSSASAFYRRLSFVRPAGALLRSRTFAQRTRVTRFSSSPALHTEPTSTPSVRSCRVRMAGCVALAATQCLISLLCARAIRPRWNGRACRRRCGRTGQSTSFPC